MKKQFLCALPLVVLAVTCLAAGPTPEQKALANRQNDIRKAFTGFIKAKDYAAAEKSAAELLATVSDPAGSSMTEADAALTIGTGYANPLNLRYVDKARAYLEQAEKGATQPFDRFQARYQLCKLNLLTGGDADYERDVAALKACLEGAGDDVRIDQLVRFIVDTAASDNLIPGYDYLATAEKAAGDSVSGQLALGSYGYRYMNRMFSKGSLDPRFSREAQLALMEKILANPEVKGIEKPDFIRNKCSLLTALGKSDEAEKYLLDRIATTNDVPVAYWYAELSRFYYSASWRYFDVREPSLVKKAAEAGKTSVRAFVKMVENKQRVIGRYNSGTKTEVADICIACGDFAGANEMLDLIVADSKGATNAFVSARLGDIAWAREDYAAAAGFYEAAGDGIDLPRHEKCARAYCATGRYAEALPHLEFCSKKGNKYTRQYYTHCYESVKAKAEK